MSLPALRAVRARFQRAQISVLARPWVADLYSREGFRLLEYKAPRGWRGFREQWQAARELRDERFDCAVLLQNAFEAAAVVMMAGIPERIGYNRDGRGWLLTEGVPVPRPGELPPHQRFYYLELLRRVNWLANLPALDEIRLEGLDEARRFGAELFSRNGVGADVIGISPGAAYGSAKRWLPENFAAAAGMLARELGAEVAIFGSRDEASLCGSVSELMTQGGVRAHNFAGRTSLREFIDMASVCRAFLTNDSGAMHIASAAGTPTVAVFGATDHYATGPTGTLARVVREPVSCSPCLLRECPIDHRCMARVQPGRVVDAALELVELRRCAG